MNAKLEPRLVSDLFLDDDGLQILLMAAEEPKGSNPPHVANVGSGRNYIETCNSGLTWKCDTQTCTYGWTLKCDRGTCTSGWTFRCDPDPTDPII
jgi:hypothetical protein